MFRRIDLEERDIDEINRILDERYTPDQLQVLDTIMYIFEGITETDEESGDGFTRYKSIDLEKIPEVLRYPAWGEAPVVEIAGQLLSRFILAHPMPNANHRTALSLVERYLRSHDESISIPDFGDVREWYPWARPYVHDSKRLVTLWRNTHLFIMITLVSYRRSPLTREAIGGKK